MKEISVSCTYKNRSWESWVKINHALQVLDMFVGERKAERLDVREKVLNFTPSDDGKDIGSLVHEIGNSNLRFKKGFERCLP